MTRPELSATCGGYVYIPISLSLSFSFSMCSFVSFRIEHASLISATARHEGAEAPRVRAPERHQVRHWQRVVERDAAQSAEDRHHHHLQVPGGDAFMHIFVLLVTSFHALCMRACACAVPQVYVWLYCILHLYAYLQLFLCLLVLYVNVNLFLDTL
jgi:hypothetical protein